MKLNYFYFNLICFFIYPSILHAATSECGQGSINGFIKSKNNETCTASQNEYHANWVIRRLANNAKIEFVKDVLISSGKNNAHAINVQSDSGGKSHGIIHFLENLTIRKNKGYSHIIFGYNTTNPSDDIFIVEKNITMIGDTNGTYIWFYNTKNPQIIVKGNLFAESVNGRFIANDVGLSGFADLSVQGNTTVKKTTNHSDKQLIRLSQGRFSFNSLNIENNSADIFKLINASENIADEKKIYFYILSRRHTYKAKL